MTPVTRNLSREDLERFARYPRGSHIRQVAEFALSLLDKADAAEGLEERLREAMRRYDERCQDVARYSRRLHDAEDALKEAQANSGIVPETRWDAAEGLAAEVEHFTDGDGDLAGLVKALAKFREGQDA